MRDPAREYEDVSPRSLFHYEMSLNGGRVSTMK